MDSPSTTPSKVPACIHHKGSGQAVVKLGGRFVYLGAYGSEAAAQNYRRAVAEWQATGGQAAVEALTVDHVIAGYWRHAEVYCRAAGTQRLLVLLAGTLADPGVKVSRMDIAFDDFAKGFSPRKFGTTCVGKNLSVEHGRLQPCVVFRIRPDNWNWDRRKGGCFWLGSVLSDCRLRVYDKKWESDGRIRSVRVELQCRNRYATMLAKRIVEGREVGESLAGCALPFLVAFVDLRMPAGPRSASQKWPRLQWSAAFVGQAQAASTGGEDLAHVLAWERNGKKPGRGMLRVQLRAQGVSGVAPGGLPEAAVVRAVDAVLDGELTPLSREQEERMRALAVRRRVGETESPH